MNELLKLPKDIQRGVMPKVLPADIDSFKLGQLLQSGAVDLSQVQQAIVVDSDQLARHSFEISVRPTLSAPGPGVDPAHRFPAGTAAEYMRKTYGKPAGKTQGKKT